MLGWPDHDGMMRKLIIGGLQPDNNVHDCIVSK